MLFCWQGSGIAKFEFRQRRNVMKRSLISMIVATTLTTAAYAGDMDTDSTSNKWEKGAKDAWIVYAAVDVATVR